MNPTGPLSCSLRANLVVSFFVSLTPSFAEGGAAAGGNIAEEVQAKLGKLVVASDEKEDEGPADDEAEIVDDDDAEEEGPELTALRDLHVSTRVQEYIQGRVLS